MLKRADILLIILLLSISLLPLFCLPGQKPDRVYADVTQNGQLVRRIALSGHTGRDIFTQTTPDGHSNTIVVDEETIAIQNADCPDKLCVQQGAARHPGDVIACLPHKLLIEVKGSQADTGLIPMR